MNPRLQPLVDWWAERPARERLLVLVSATAAVLVAGDALITAPAERRLKQLRTTVQTQQSRLDAARLAAAPGNDAQLQREQALRLQQRVHVAQQAVAQLRQQAAESARLPETLRAITATVGSARLLALDLTGDAAATAAAAAAAATPAPASNSEASTDIAANAAVPVSARLYRLPITLKVSGTYEELQMLLTQIERHAQALQWSSLTLDSSEWPAIQMTLKAHVLSPDPRWGAAS
jgi:MSHA biogenesis protein MshJ